MDKSERMMKKFLLGLTELGNRILIEEYGNTFKTAEEKAKDHPIPLQS